MATSSSPPRRGGSGLRWSAWNLLLLVPLLMLVTPWFNFDQPRAFGMPFFYWYQFLFVVVGVVCVWLVYVKTQHLDDGHPARAAKLDVDSLDTGNVDGDKDTGAQS